METAIVVKKRQRAKWKTVSIWTSAALILANTSEAYHLVGPGQSGHVRSKWYHDQMSDWANGTYHKTKLSQPSAKKLTLKPLN